MKRSSINAKDIPAVYGIHSSTVRQIIKRRLLPFMRPCRGTVLFQCKVIEAWIQAGQVESVGQMARRVSR